MACTYALYIITLNAEEISMPFPFTGETREERFIMRETPIYDLVRYSKIAGIGRFVSQPVFISTNNNKFAYVDLIVDDCWAGDVQNETVRIANYFNYDMHGFPTNVPVVFFAHKYKPYNVGDFIDVNATNFFKFGDRAWFRPTRDNGLLYTYTTNLWDCIRTHPNITNQFEVLLSAFEVEKTQSARINYDNEEPFEYLCFSMPSDILVEKYYKIPLTNLTPKSAILNVLFARKWTFENGVWIRPLVEQKNAFIPYDVK